MTTTPAPTRPGLHRVTFADCLFEAASNKEFVAQFDRLTGYNLSFRGSPLDLSIDDVTGRTEEGLAVFIAFVREFIWERLPEDAKLVQEEETHDEKA